MRVRAVDSNGDYVCTGATSEFLVDSAAAVAQLIQTGLALWQGQWWLDLSVGVPWSTEVLVRFPPVLYDSAIKDAVLNVAGVNAITSYSSNVTSRRLDRQRDGSVDLRHHPDRRHTPDPSPSDGIRNRGSGRNPARLLERSLAIRRIHPKSY